MSSYLSVAALGIPEILLIIGHFLSRKDICACIRVSRTFHAAFITVLWEHVVLEQNSVLLKSVAAVKAHSPHIQSLTLRSGVPSEFYQLRYENLTSLTVDPRYVQKSSNPSSVAHEQTQLVQLNPTIKALALKHLFLPLSKAFWDAVGTWETPQSLHMSEIKIAPEASDSFWRACSRFQDLEIDQVGVQLFTKRIDFEFPRIKSLTLEDGYPSNVFLGLESHMELLCLVPGLLRLDWKVLWSNLELEGFQQLLHRKDVMFPKLRSLCIYGAFFTDEKIASILEHAPVLTRFSDNSMRAGSLTFSRLKNDHFGALDTLSVIGCASFTSPVVLEVLSSCPKLRVFTATYISVTDIVQSPQPWVCSRLERLEVWIAKPTKCPTEWEREVFKRISQFEFLEELHLHQSDHAWLATSWTDDTRPLDMTLASGLGLLTGLVRLRSLWMMQRGQELDREDIEFMLEHWKGLRDVRGTLSRTPSRHEELAAMLVSRGVRLVKDIDHSDSSYQHR
ncbi:hypothetical protein EC968_006676 [Mortierella alpina]|nr:hypothetical protein EC968_006676 [Mortierella alpina]